MVSSCLYIVFDECYVRYYTLCCKLCELFRGCGSHRRRRPRVQKEEEPVQPTEAGEVSCANYRTYQMGAGGTHLDVIT